MAGNPQPFEDVVMTGDGFSIPQLKWRELVFIGAVREQDGHFVRDPARPLPPFRRSGLFAEGERYRVSVEGTRVRLHRVEDVAATPGGEKTKKKEKAGKKREVPARRRA